MFINSSQAYVLENLDKKSCLWETLLGGTKYHVLSANPIWLLPLKARRTKGVCWLCTWRRLHNLLLCLLHHTCSPLVMDDSVSFFLKCHNKCWSYINTTIRPSGFKSQLVLKQAQWPFADVFNLKITDFCSCCIDTSLYRWYLQGKLPHTSYLEKNAQTAQTRLCYFFRLAGLFFASGHTSTVFFAFYRANWQIRWLNNPVSLRGGQTCF